MRTILVFLLAILAKPSFSQTVTSADSTADPDFVFEKVEVEASFPGGEKQWMNFLLKNIDPSVPVDKGCRPGTYTVRIQFIVERDGRIRDVKALTNHGFGMEEEFMRVIKKGPKWIPATQNGRLVNAYRKLPFTFVIARE